MAVSSASLRKGHIGSVDIFITDKCLLRIIMIQIIICINK